MGGSLGDHGLHINYRGRGSNSKPEVMITHRDNGPLLLRSGFTSGASMFLTGEGKTVAINHTSPTSFISDAALDVSGNLKVTGDINVTGDLNVTNDIVQIYRLGKSYIRSNSGGQA